MRLVSGSALLIDYVLTITVSIAAGADAIFDFLPKNSVFLGRNLIDYKLPMEYAAVGLLIVMNLRGIKESIKVIVPVFVLFLVTHAILLGSVLFKHGGEIPAKAADLASQTSGHLHTIGFMGMFLIFMQAFSRGAGTFTGIEAVSNGLSIMRDPKVATGKRTHQHSFGVGELRRRRSVHPGG